MAGLLVTYASSATGDATQKVVFLGDSITAGYGLDPDQAYPALLEKRFRENALPHVVRNAGVSGDTTSGGLRRVDWALSQGADLLVIALGGNDGLRGVPPAQTKENLRGIIRKARKSQPGIEILVAGMQMPESMGKEYTERFAKIFPEVAKEESVGLIPFLLEGVAGSAALNQPDRIHPNAEGQKVIADGLWPYVRDAVAE